MNMDYAVAAALAAFIAWRAFGVWQVRRKLPELLRAGAQVIDVRTPAEFASGHASQSRNIPLDELGGRFQELDPQKWVIVCCASGSRSATARRFLQRHGFAQVFNAGSWRRLS